MNREILFKGRSYEADEWVEGSFLEEGDSNAYILTSHGTYRVNPDTVCQYTGLKDKNGVKIFEGDIVQIDNEYMPFKVIWSIGNAKYSLDNGHYRCHFKSNQRYHYDPDFVEPNECSVIGNVFDSPEMLKDAAQYADQGGLMPTTREGGMGEND